MAPSTLLDLLRSVSQVDCDTMDIDVARDLGPFVDCTSNQAIAYLELAKLTPGTGDIFHKELIQEAIRFSKNDCRQDPEEASFVTHVVDVMMVKLQLRFAKHTTGFLHVQVNPNFAWESKAIEAQARRIVAIASSLDPELDSRRVCIKIPATWEGLQAAAQLEQDNIATLATIVFGMGQAALAAHRSCTYIAPYVNELRVHFEPGYESESKLFELCKEAQAYYVQHQSRTKVLAASLTSIDECMQLAGVQHITISPPLLRGLASFDAEAYAGELGAFFRAPLERQSWKQFDYDRLCQSKTGWHEHLSSQEKGAERKLHESIDIFKGFQTKLEDLVRQQMQD